MKRAAVFRIGAYVVAAVVTADLLLGGISWIRTQQRASAIEAELRSSLPVGMHAREADAYLTRRGIEHSYVPQERTMYALVRGIGRSLFFRTDLQVTVDFNEREEVDKIDFQTVGTGP